MEILKVIFLQLNILIGIWNVHFACDDKMNHIEMKPVKKSSQTTLGLNWDLRVPASPSYSGTSSEYL